MRRETCSVEKTAAFSSREHTWISLRVQATRHVHATGCCVRTPHARTLGSISVLKQTSPAKRLLRTYAASTLGSRSVLKETYSGKTTAAYSRREHTGISLRAQGDMFHRKDCCDLALPPKNIDDSCGRQIQFIQSSAHMSLTLSGTRDPKPQSARLCFTDCRPNKRIRCWGNIVW